MKMKLQNKFSLFPWFVVGVIFVFIHIQLSLTSTTTTSLSAHQSLCDEIEEENLRPDLHQFA